MFSCTINKALALRLAWSSKNHCSCWKEHFHFPLYTGRSFLPTPSRLYWCSHSLTTNWVWELIQLKIKLFTEDFFPRLVYRLTSPVVEFTKQILSGRNKQAGMRVEAAAWMNAGLNWLWHLSFSLVCISRNGPLMCSKYSTLWEARNWHYGMREYSWLLKRLHHRHASKSTSVGVQ